MDDYWLLMVLVALFLVFLANQSKPRPVSELPIPEFVVEQLIKSGKTIKAIKVYRQQTGASLYEANGVVKHYAKTYL